MNNQQALAFAAQLARSGVLALERPLGVTLTVAPGACLAAVGGAFGRHYQGATAGVWLVPESDASGKPHYHGLVVTSEPQAIVSTWQRCGGGIERCQKIDPIDPADGEHVRSVVAYALKRRDCEPGEIVCEGVLSTPWGLVCNAESRAESVPPPWVSLPSFLPRAPEIDDDAWSEEHGRWPPDLREALRERVECYRRLGRGNERQRAYWAYRALRSLATASSGMVQG